MKPIIFNTIMTEAVNENIKTATRRKLKIPDHVISNYSDYVGTSLKELMAVGLLQPPYVKGDILYVRETWNTQPDGTYIYRAGLSADEAEGMKWKPAIHMPKEAARTFLRVTDVYMQRLQDISDSQALAEGIREYTKDGKVIKYAPDIDWWRSYHRKHPDQFHHNWWQDMPDDPVKAFSCLYDSTLKKEDIGVCDWSRNVYVWVIEFEKLCNMQKKEDAQ